MFAPHGLSLFQSRAGDSRRHRRRSMRPGGTGGFLLQETEAAIQAGLLLEEDREESIERAMKQAEKYGLK